jgi:Fe-Mn family superoxide dismutase
MAYTLPPLPFDYNALEPHIDETTMRVHHGKHHQTYVTNLNAALEGQAGFQDLPIEKLVQSLDKLPEAIRAKVRNNGGGHLNHTLFWNWMKPGGSNAPDGALKRDLDAGFGGFDKFKEQFQNAGLNRFGSGWAWLVRGKDGKLAIESTPNQDNPLMDGKHPVLGCDVWEHAYYLKYQNRRADYLTAWWNVVNWSAVGQSYQG